MGEFSIRDDDDRKIATGPAPSVLKDSANSLQRMKQKHISTY